MGKYEKLLRKILCGTADKNIEFAALCSILQRLGFTERIKGGHHIFTKDYMEEIINIQPIGHQAKAYQVKQIRELILKYKLGDAL